MRNEYGIHCSEICLCPLEVWQIKLAIGFEANGGLIRYILHRCPYFHRAELSRNLVHPKLLEYPNFSTTPSTNTIFDNLPLKLSSRLHHATKHSLKLLCPTCELSNKLPAKPTYLEMAHQQHAPMHRTREPPQGDEEAGAELKLGEFQHVDALTHSEAALVINALVATRKNKESKNSEYVLPADAALSAQHP
jgi:hypothetical protein